MSELARNLQQLQTLLRELQGRVRRLEARDSPVSVPGSGSLMAAGVSGTAVTLLPAGAVGYVITLLYAVRAVTGADENGGTVTLAPGDSFALYNDGTDVLTLAVSVGGALTVQRTAGADTFDVKVMGIWL